MSNLREKLNVGGTLSRTAITVYRSHTNCDASTYFSAASKYVSYENSPEFRRVLSAESRRGGGTNVGNITGAVLQIFVANTSVTK
jgi:hypothetical protein